MHRVCWSLRRQFQNSEKTDSHGPVTEQRLPKAFLSCSNTFPARAHIELYSFVAVPLRTGCVRSSELRLNPRRASSSPAARSKASSIWIRFVHTMIAAPSLLHRARSPDSLACSTNCCWSSFCPADCCLPLLLLLLLHYPSAYSTLSACSAKLARNIWTRQPPVHAPSTRSPRKVRKLFSLCAHLFSRLDIWSRFFHDLVTCYYVSFSILHLNLDFQSSTSNDSSTPSASRPKPSLA